MLTNYSGGLLPTSHRGDLIYILKSIHVRYVVDKVAL
jgi:hypothetical protein